MRLMVTAELDTATGNPLIESGKISEVVGGILESLKPESAYFLAKDGRRCMILVVDVPDSSHIATVVEPFWLELNARVDVVPCMNAEDLQAGLARLH
jgi:hypothetical protein